MALLLTLFDVRLIAYCLMDNHLHLLLSGCLEACLGFYDRVVHRIAQHNAGEYGITGILSCDDVDIVAVTNDQQLKNEICYIHRNPYKARISSPLAYRWCSADVYFSTFIQSGKKAGSLSVRERRRLFKTHIPVPDDYEFIGGRILNKSFVSFEMASGRFRDSVEYFDCLRKFSYVSPQGACGLYYDVPAGAFQEPGEIRDCFAGLVKEVSDLADAMGIGFGEDIVEANLKILAGLSPDMTTSLQRDVAAGKASEIDGLIYEVVRMGKKYGVSTPLYEKISAELKQKIK